MLIAQNIDSSLGSGTLFTISAIFPKVIKLQSLNVVLKGSGKAEVVLEQSGAPGVWTLVKSLYLPAEGMALAENFSGTEIVPLTTDTTLTRSLRCRFVKTVAGDELKAALDYYVV